MSKSRTGDEPGRLWVAPTTRIDTSCCKKTRVVYLTLRMRCHPFCREHMDGFLGKSAGAAASLRQVLISLSALSSKMEKSHVHWRFRAFGRPNRR